MKRHDFFHGLAVISCIPIFIKDWVSSTLILIGIISSYINSHTSYKRKLEIEIIQEEKNKMIEKISKLETEACEYKMKLATKNLK